MVRVFGLRSYDCEFISRRRIMSSCKTLYFMLLQFIHVGECDYYVYILKSQPCQILLHAETPKRDYVNNYVCLRSTQLFHQPGFHCSDQQEP